MRKRLLVNLLALVLLAVAGPLAAGTREFIALPEVFPPLSPNGHYALVQLLLNRAGGRSDGRKYFVATVDLRSGGIAGRQLGDWGHPKGWADHSDYVIWGEDHRTECLNVPGLSVRWAVPWSSEWVVWLPGSEGVVLVRLREPIHPNYPRWPWDIIQVKMNGVSRVILHNCSWEPLRGVRYQGGDAMICQSREKDGQLAVISLAGRVLLRFGPSVPRDVKVAYADLARVAWSRDEGAMDASACRISLAHAEQGEWRSVGVPIHTSPYDADFTVRVLDAGAGNLWLYRCSARWPKYYQAWTLTWDGHLRELHPPAGGFGLCLMALLPDRRHLFVDHIDENVHPPGSFLLINGDNGRIERRYPFRVPPDWLKSLPAPGGAR